MFTVTACSQTEQVIYTFSVGEDPQLNAVYPVAGLTSDAEGNLYGTARGGDYIHLSVAGAAFELSPGAGGIWNETNIVKFPGGQFGSSPNSSLASDSSGNLYGVTYEGGYDGGTCFNAGCGEVFELSPVSGGGWKETVVFPFKGGAGGSRPGGGVVLDAVGNIYGTTSEGGNLSDCRGAGCGVVFKLSPSSHGWHETIIHTFTGGTDGAYPAAPLLMDGSGNLYGTAESGGNLKACNSYGCGVAYELSESSGAWKETVLHSFTGGVDDAYPSSPLVFDSTGNLYGTTYQGGDLSGCNAFGCGTVFALSRNSDGWKMTVLRIFGGGQDGANPAAGLILDSAGNLYGTTVYGGASGDCGSAGCGTAFELSPSSGVWSLRVLHAFTGEPDGAFPYGGLLFDKAGNLYGTTEYGGFGGVGGVGTVFEITP